MGVFFIISNSKGSTVKFVWQKSIKHIPKISFQVIQQFRVHRVFKNSRKSNMIINCFALIHSPTPLRRSSVEKRCFNHSTRKWLVNMLIFTTVQGAWRRLVLYVRVSRRNHCAMMTKDVWDGWILFRFDDVSFPECMFHLKSTMFNSMLVFVSS